MHSKTQDIFVKFSFNHTLSRVGAAFLSGTSRLPLWLHYAVSDMLIYPILRYVLRYRRKVVRRNLETSFPDRPLREVREIETRFYHWFSDMLVEMIKAHTIGRKAILRRVEWRGVEEVQKAIDEGHDFALTYLSHYYNWEWCVGFPLQHPACGLCQIYHPLRDPVFDAWFAKSRSRFGAFNIPMKQTLRLLLRLRGDIKEQNILGSDGRTPVRGMVFGCIADQVPKSENIHLRLPFLNHDTGVFTGSERLGRKFDMAFFYAHFQQPRRGHYVVTFERLDPLPEAETDEYAYTRAYFARLERDIQAHPEYWLWTHNRWKR